MYDCAHWSLNEPQSLSGDCGDRAVFLRGVLPLHAFREPPERGPVNLHFEQSIHNGVTEGASQFDVLRAWKVFETREFPESCHPRLARVALPQQDFVAPL